ncbi:Asp-tRNA(Asn)/Glu-tRNA(Gln) amidotransferase subunit GatB [Patescibacteria group bacterium]|nr:Asp-tRNA(Asn)/Glu-tRNA(Gln) amidotransferase subunit GatB [Patescibacteria group bacterium]
MKEYVPTIGLEIHVQLKTASKMFCRCDNNAEGKEPNTVVCPLCMGFPGVLPVVNATAIEYGVKTALALGCKINKFQRFDRKNYFYPDLPKAYQISQFFFPVGEHGEITIDYLGSDRKTRKEFKVGINRVHLEEDAGKLIHTKDATLVDFNRCGTPLMEIVTEPDITSPEEAKAFMQELQRIVRSLGVSFADMEKGHLRVDANVSVRPKGQKKLGVKIEVKNMNSFKFMEQALKHEIERQISALEAGEKLQQETRGWDAKTGTTILQRVKEGSIDYRYFPEPDLPPIVLDDKQINDWSKEVTAELPSALRAKAEKTGLSYEKICELQDKNALINLLVILDKNKKLDPTVIANYPGASSEFYKWIVEEKPSNSVIRQVFDSISSGKKFKDAVDVVKIVDHSDLMVMVKRVLDANPDVVKRYKAGETKLIGFLTGQIMKQAGGGADPISVTDLLNKLLT